jgi:hypothetical protein
MHFVYGICDLSIIICNKCVVVMQQHKTNVIIFIWNLIKYITYIKYIKLSICVHSYCDHISTCTTNST